jgi:tetratricopeptide (TPR) repeat protein
MTTSPPVSALEEQARGAYQAGRWKEAGAAFEAAASAHAQAGNELQAAEMANNASVAYLQANQAGHALALVEGTSQVFDRLGDAKRAAQAEGNRASALAACGRLEEAEVAYVSAAEQLRGLGDDEAAAATLQALSQVQLRRGQPVEAIASLQRGLESAPHLSLRQRFLRWLARLPLRLMGG